MTTVAALGRCESGNRVDWDLRVLTVTQLGNLFEAVGIPNSMARHLSCAQANKRSTSFPFSLQTQVKDDDAKW